MARKTAMGKEPGNVSIALPQSEKDRLRGGGRRMYSGGKQRRRMASYKMRPASANYLRSLLNPSVLGAKIPDSFGGKTCTVQLQRELALDAIGNGSTLTPLNCIGALMHISPCAYMWSTAYSAAAAAWRWSQAGYIEGKPVADLNLPKMFRSARVVSAGIKLQFSGTTQNDQGTVTVFAIDRTHLQNAQSVTGGDIGNPAEFALAADVAPIGSTISGVTRCITGSDLRNLPINAYGPVRLGCTARYFPIDDTDLQSNVIPPAVDSVNVTPGSVGAIGFFAEGVATGASVIVQFTVNVECTVKDDSFNMVTTESSPVDPMGLAAAATVYLKKNQVAVGAGRGDTESINVYSR